MDRRNSAVVGLLSSWPNLGPQQGEQIGQLSLPNFLQKRL